MESQKGRKCSFRVFKRTGWKENACKLIKKTVKDLSQQNQHFESMLEMQKQQSNQMQLVQEQQAQALRTL